MAAILNLVHAGARVFMAHGFLYKYKPLTEDAFNHVREIISESKIFCPRPSQLNDTKECKPMMTIDDVEADIEYQAGVESSYRILSLADSPINHHLWEAYANNFNGVCLQFAVDSRFGDAYQVFYTDDARLLDPTNVDNYGHLEKTFLLKRRKWRKEKEIRLIFGEPPLEGQPPLTDQKYAFQPSRLPAIIIGYKVTVVRRAKLIALAHARKPRLYCYEAFPFGQRLTVRLRRLTIWSRSRPSRFSCAPPRSDARKQKGRRARIKWGRVP